VASRIGSYLDAQRDELDFSPHKAMKIPAIYLIYKKNPDLAALSTARA